MAGSYLWLNPGNRSFAGTIPDGASAAGVSLTFNPAERDGSVSLVQTFAAALYGGRWDNWAGWRATGADAHSINTDPLFVAIPRNFALQRTSPALDAGLTIPGITSDILGIARPRGSGYSMGAYET